MKKNDLLEVIKACTCAPCRALISIRAEAGANILVSRTNTGRMCELAVVAAAGPNGLTANEVVTRREAYAGHLGVELTRTSVENRTPYVIEWALKHSNHSPPNQKRHEPVNLGRAHASKHSDGRFSLVWDGAPKFDHAIDQGSLDAMASGKGGVGVIHGIEISWPAGIERIELDLNNLSSETQITDTVQLMHATVPGSKVRFEYGTTSSVTTQSNGAFLLALTYEHENNLHIPREESWWGITTLLLRPGVKEGAAHWTDGSDPENNCAHVFRAAVWDEEDGDENDRQIRADETAIEQRKDLTSTAKLQLIEARRGKGKFRKRVLRKESYCRITGVDDPAHLRASHIKPWADANDGERLDGDNGLMLAPHMDHLFDKAYISFDNDGRLLVVKDPVIHALLAVWKIDPAAPAVQVRPFNVRQCAYLAEHRQRLARRQAGDSGLTRMLPIRR
jgi:hypothetical protein